MAENTLIVTGLKSGDRYEIANAPGAGEGTKVSESSPARVVVSCGASPSADTVVTICDSQGVDPLAEGLVGEIVVNSRSASPGYWLRLGDKSDRYPDQIRTLRTGDLGFMRDGELYVSGRIKNTLVSRGRKIIAEDVESLLEQQLTLLRRFRAAVCQPWTGDGETIVVVLEGLRSPESSTSEVAEAVAVICRTHFGFVPGGVEVVRPSSLPRTTSGKLRRDEVARLWSLGCNMSAPCAAGMEVRI